MPVGFAPPDDAGGLGHGHRPSWPRIRGCGPGWVRPARSVSCGGTTPPARTRRPGERSTGRSARADEVGPPSAAWYVAPVTMAHRVDDVTDADRARVEALLGRPTSARFEIVVRGDDGRPIVIRNEPFLDDGTPMPTRYWLVDPALRARIGTSSRTAACARPRPRSIRTSSRPPTTGTRPSATPPSRRTTRAPVPRVASAAPGAASSACTPTTPTCWPGGDDPVGRWVEARLDAGPGRRARRAPMGERYAAIDCGTNSTRLLVAEPGPTDGLARTVERLMRITRLGRGVSATGAAPARRHRPHGRDPRAGTGR